MRTRFMLSLIAVVLLVVAGCHSTGSEGDGGAANKETVGENKPAENTADNSTKEQPKEEPKEDEFCLLPPEPQDEELAGKIEVGQDAIDFAMTDSLTGKEFKISDFKGKTVLLFFWASWCPYCKMAFRAKGSLNKFWKELDSTSSASLVIIGIGTGTDDTDENQKAFLKTNEATFLSMHDGNRKIEQAYGVLGMPTCVVIGREGKILTYGSYRYSDYSDKLLEYLRQSCIQNPESE
ncbi:MAG: TlpA family protein disulfide reductase [Planctomycetes bacterium]|nr:TlpA family protein disulfide reductase [Planctomycetota bacterium]